MATKPAAKPAKPKPRKLSDKQLAARISRDSAELAKRVGAAKSEAATKPKATAKPKTAPRK